MKGGGIMADDTRAKPAEEQTPPEPVPSSEQKVPEPTKVQETAPKEEVPETKIGAEGELELPKGASERTKKQFNKLKSQLKEYRERLFGEQVFRDIKPTPAKKVEGERKLYDPETGIVDVQALERLESRTVRAEEDARRSKEAVTRYIESTQSREAYASHPELDPKGDKFDEKLHRTTRAFIMDSTAFPDSYGGRTLSYKEAADLAKEAKVTGQPVPEEKPETPKQAAERLTPKEQASLEASGRPTPGVRKELSEEEAERERVLTRLGQREAMTERMSRIPEVPASRKKET